jgi:hypothetical protein
MLNCPEHLASSPPAFAMRSCCPTLRLAKSKDFALRVWGSEVPSLIGPFGRPLCAATGHNPDVGLSFFGKAASEPILNPFRPAL